MIDVQQCEELR